MEPNKHKHNSLVFYRRRMGFSQKHVARMLGLRDASMVSHYEHGRCFPPLPMALGLEIILRVPVAFLFPALYDEARTRFRQLEEEAGNTQPRLL